MIYIFSYNFYLLNNCHNYITFVMYSQIFNGTWILNMEVKLTKVRRSEVPQGNLNESSIISETIQ